MSEKAEDALESPSENPAENTLQSETEASEGLERWYDSWRDRIHEWVADHSQEEVADYLLLLPDLVTLLIRLIREPCVPLGFKGRLILAALYVASPIDIMPEIVLGVAGLADDLVVIVMAIMSGLTEIDHEVIRKHWSGKDDIIDVLYDVNEKAEDLMNTELAQTIKKFFMEWQTGKKTWRDLLKNMTGTANKDA